MYNMSLPNDHFIQKINKLRLLLHSIYYNNPLVINTFIQKLSLNLSGASIEYDDNVKLFKIKMKKSEIKKQNIEPKIESYYYLISLSLYQVFEENLKFLDNIIIGNCTTFNLNHEDINIFKDINNMVFFYNATTIINDTIMISL